MKKLFVALLTLVLTTSAANAALLGLFNVGGRIGIVTSSQSIPMDTEGIQQAILAEGTGWTGTVFARLNIPKLPLYIQPELQYTKSTLEIPEIFGGQGSAEEGATHRYIDLPILLGAEVGLGSLASVRLNLGPVFNIANEKGFGDLTKDDFLEAYKHPTVSWTAGIGVKVLGFIAEFRYNGGFGEEGFDIKNLKNCIDTTNTSWNLSVGLMF